MEKSTIDGIIPNPNVIVTNLSDRTLSNDEYEILAYGLNHGLHKRAKENDLLASTESVFKQLTKLNVLKKNRYSIERVKVDLKAFSFSLLDLEDCRIFKDEKNIKLIKDLMKKVTILKPDKCNGVVLVNNEDYI